MTCYSILYLSIYLYMCMDEQYTPYPFNSINKIVSIHPTTSQDRANNEIYPRPTENLLLQPTHHSFGAGLYPFKKMSDRSVLIEAVSIYLIFRYGHLPSFTYFMLSSSLVLIILATSTTTTTSSSSIISKIKSVSHVILPLLYHYRYFNHSNRKSAHSAHWLSPVYFQSIWTFIHTTSNGNVVVLILVCF